MLLSQPNKFLFSFSFSFSRQLYQHFYIDVFSNIPTKKKDFLFWSDEGRNWSLEGHFIFVSGLPVAHSIFILFFCTHTIF